MQYFFRKLNTAFYIRILPQGHKKHNLAQFSETTPFAKAPKKGLPFFDDMHFDNDFRKPIDCRIF